MNNSKLSLAEFKANTEKVEKNEVLEKIQGGTNSSCHTSEVPYEQQLGNTLRRIFIFR